MIRPPAIAWRRCPMFNHHQRETAERRAGMQHDHHDLTVVAMHSHLDHENCLEAVILKGPATPARHFARALLTSAACAMARSV